MLTATIKKCLAFFLFLLAVKSAVSQIPVLHWAKSFNSHNNHNASLYSNGRTVAVDHQGNVYSAGLFNYTVDFDPGPGFYDLTTANSFNSGIYLSKLSPAGDFLWAIKVDALVEFGQIEITVDQNDNVYLSSELRYPTDFDPGPGVFTLTPIGAWDAFVAKYDPNGNLVWAKQFGGSGDTVPRPDILTVDNNNDIVICGNFNNTVDFDPGPGVFNLTSSAHIQVFIVKLSNDGNLKWAKQFGNSSDIYSGSLVGDVKCDGQGNIYTVGNFKGLCDFDPGTGNYPLQSVSFYDGFIAKLDPNGNFIWAKRIGSTEDYYDYCFSRGIAIDKDNNVYTTGNFIGTLDFDPGANNRIITSNAYDDWYVLKLNPQGDFQWVDVIGGYDQDIGADVDVDIEGNIYTCGPIGHNADMDPGPGVYNITTVNKYGSSALVKLNPAGELIYAVSFEAYNDQYGSSLTRRMVVDNNMNIYMAGSVGGTVDFDPGPDVYPVSSGSYGAPMVMKLGRCFNVTTSTLTVSSCDAYTFGSQILDKSGTYNRTLPNSLGCDSIITLKLTINKKFTEQTKIICQGESFFAGGASQTVEGIYKDTLRSSLNCDSIVTTHLTVNVRPVPNLGKDRALCMGTQAIISPGTFKDYRWQDMSTKKELTVSAPGLYWVQVSNEFDCIARDSMVVTAMNPSPSDFLNSTDSICQYGKVQVAAAASFKKYEWSTGSTDRIITVEQTGQYRLQVTDANGCVGSDTITIANKDCMVGVFIPTAFSPGNDGRNDFFKASVNGKIVYFKLQVFDRNGQLVFQTTDPEKGWDGKTIGMSNTTSVYIWQCSYQLFQQAPAYQKGTVTLVR